ncbi:MAG: 23S rRNA (uracil(1939)-C(5))-methyltransferase RlmD [Bacteroidales bacterium]
MRRKKEKFTLHNVEITGFAAEGNAIAKTDDKVIFVPFAVPGDIVDIEVFKQKKSYCEARVIDIKSYSDKRIAVKCPHFTYCGGCKWQMLAYEWQLKYKQQQVIDNLTRIGKIDCGNISIICGSADIYYYRNKLEFTFSNKAWVKDFVKGQIPQPALGFHISGLFDKVLNIENCVLQKNISNRIRNFLRQYTLERGIPYYDIREHNGIMRTLVVRTTLQGDLMVLIAFALNDINVINDVLNALKDNFPEISSLQYCINDKLNDSLADRDFILFYGKDYVIELMPQYGDKTAKPLQFKIRPKTFYQVNPLQALKLYTFATDFAQISNQDIVYDLYTGTGTIANFVANKAKKVVGIEYVEDAVEDARVNSKENEINNTIFYAGDMSKVLNDDFILKNGKPDIIITDPPRNGMDVKVVMQILKIFPKRIVYISCNPATQARDVALMSEQYKVEKIQPVDMFPHTHHIENVILLSKKD